MSNEYRQLVGLVAEDRLRWLGRVLADEPQWDRRTLLRLGAWATSTVGALVIAMLSVHWTQDVRREQVAALDLARQSQNLQVVAREAQAENRRLTAAIETLNGDRDRLYARVTVLEQGLDSVTGAVTRQSLPASMVLLSATVPITLPPPVIAAPAVMPAHVADPTTAPEQDTAAAPRGPSPSPIAQAASQAPAAQAAGAERQPLAASTLYGPPDPGAPHLVEAAPAPHVAAERRDKPMDSAAEKPVESSADRNVAPAPVSKPDTRKDPAPDPRVQVANTQPATQEAAPAPATAAGPPATEVPALRTEFGVDLGSANSLDGLRGLWQGLVKAESGLFSPLRPVVAIRERNNGLGMQLRLVAGPLSDAAAAARICAALAENNRGCETTVFDGQRLALKPQTEPAPVQPADHPARVSTHAVPRTSTHGSRHASARPAKREERPPEPPPPAAAAAPAPATTQSTPSPSVLPEFLRGR